MNRKTVGYKMLKLKKWNGEWKIKIRRLDNAGYFVQKFLFSCLVSVCALKKN